MKTQIVKIQNKIAMVLFIGAAIMLYTWMNKANADMYNGDFEISNSTTGLPAGWKPRTFESYQFRFAKRVEYKRCTGTGHMTRCQPDHAVKIWRSEVGPKFQYIELNANRLQPVTPGETRRYSDRAGCNTRMPVIISYFNANKKLMNRTLFSWEGILTDTSYQWKEYKAWYTIPAGVAYVSLSRAVVPSTLIGGLCYVDDVSNVKVK